MSQTSTVYNFEISLSDMDRGVYEDLSLKVACHPSETTEYMVARVLAYAIELQEGLSFTQGLAVADEPALWVRDLTGRLQAWIEVGTPDAARLHKATKACGRAAVYCHKDIDAYLRALAGQRIHARERLEIIELDRAFVAALSERVGKRTRLTLSITEGQLYADLGGESFAAPLVRHRLPWGGTS
jgi:uncharacterized protein YaeQ